MKTLSAIWRRIGPDVALALAILALLVMANDLINQAMHHEAHRLDSAADNSVPVRTRDVL